MNLQKLTSNNKNEVSSYIHSKFKTFNSIRYSKKSRKKKCIQYYLAAAESPYGEEVIENQYQVVFSQLFPLQEAEAAKQSVATMPHRHKVAASEWLENQQEYGDELQSALSDCENWKAENRYQEGESFFSQLVTRLQFFDETICDTTQFNSEFKSESRADITATTALTAEQASAQFDLMVGHKQSASCSFESRDENWGEISGKLEESFKAGLWASGNAKATMDRMGFSAEVQAAIAIGAQLDLSGDLTWSKGSNTLKLGGEAQVFVGGKAELKAKFSASAIAGLEASIKAGAFAGFSASVKGHCTYSHDGTQIARVEAEASVTFGVGAELEASIKAPIFGPTEISFKAGLSVGLGSSISTKASIDFSEAALAANAEFRKAVHWRTLAKGYKMDLMNSDARNLYYLNKAINRLQAEIADTSNTVRSYQKLPGDKRPLLM